MRALVVLSFDLDSPEDVAGILQAINPPLLPLFAGVARIVVEPEASRIERWLDS